MLVKKAGMVVLGAAAGMVALTPAAFAGDAPAASPSLSSSGGHQGWGGQGRGGQDGHHHGDEDQHRHHGHHHGGDDRHHGHHPHSGAGASARNGDCIDGGNALVKASCNNVQAPVNQLGVASSYDNRGGHGGGASARTGDSATFGDSLVDASGNNVQAPINQLGVLSSYRNG